VKYFVSSYRVFIHVFSGTKGIKMTKKHESYSHNKAAHAVYVVLMLLLMIMMMMMKCSGVLIDTTSHSTGSSDTVDVADSHADTVTADTTLSATDCTDSVRESPPPVRPRRRSMAMAIDRDMPPDDDDVRYYACLLTVIIAPSY